MNYLLPFLFLLVCPLMFFMMRGMSGGHGGGQASHQTPSPEMPVVSDARDERLAGLEREVQALRADRDRREANRP